MTRGQEPDWAALAERHGEQQRRRKHIRAVAAGVAATAAITGMVVAVLPGDSGRDPARAAAAPDNSASAQPDDSPSSSAGESAAPSASATASASPSASASALPSAGVSRPATPVTNAPPPAGTSAPARPPVSQPAATPTPGNAQTSPPPVGKSYTPVQVCGSGFNVIDSHSLGGATVYLLYKGATGDNCVTTIVNNPAYPVPMNATLAVKDGGSASNPGSFASYAGPVTKRAANTCVQWGGSYQDSTWTSGWTHCG
ncbi:hypothetical protein ACFQ0T_41355 [Kitasatospora gansuensis]